MKRIVLTGGGTAGHVTPNIALIPELKAAGYDIQYIGSYDGMEKKLIEDMGISYHGISSGKLRRYFSMKNFSDPFRVLKGMSEAKKLMKELGNDLISYTYIGFLFNILCNEITVLVIVDTSLHITYCLRWQDHSVHI